MTLAYLNYEQQHASITDNGIGIFIVYLSAVPPRTASAAAAYMFEPYCNLLNGWH